MSTTERDGRGRGTANGPAPRAFRASAGFSRAVPLAPDASKGDALCRPLALVSARSVSKGRGPSNGKDNSFRGGDRRARLRNASPPPPVRHRNVDRFPFRRAGTNRFARPPRDGRTDRPFLDVDPRLRIGSLVTERRSHETFLHFGLQGSRLNVRYYHQDPHRRPLRPGSPRGLLRDLRVSSTPRGLLRSLVAGASRLAGGV